MCVIIALPNKTYRYLHDIFSGEIVFVLAQFYCRIYRETFVIPAS